MVRDILGHHRPASYKCPSSDGYAANNGSIGPDGGSFLYQRLQIASPPLGVLRPGGQVVGEHTGGAAEHMVLQCHTFIQRNIILDLAAVADCYIVGDVHVLSERAVLADRCSALDVAEMPDLGSLPYGHVVIHVG